MAMNLGPNSLNSEHYLWYREAFRNVGPDGLAKQKNILDRHMAVKFASAASLETCFDKLDALLDLMAERGCGDLARHPVLSRFIKG